MGKINSKILYTAILINFIFLFSCSNKGTEPRDVTLKQAEEIVLSKLLNNTDSGKIVYELQNKISAGTKIHSADSMFSSSTNSWFFFIDDAPDYYWVHPCRYVFICCTSGEQTVFKGDLFPPNNLENLTIVNF